MDASNNRTTEVESVLNLFASYDLRIADAISTNQCLSSYHVIVETKSGSKYYLEQEAILQGLQFRVVKIDPFKDFGSMIIDKIEVGHHMRAYQTGNVDGTKFETTSVERILVFNTRGRKES
ncbi:TPA: hypothetical protein DDW69_03675 [candidate division CPR2 bacterium]|uniref:Uncharacterized protein n=1 Tax=candidate division CPR2 bacterium GW2011_GWC1_41_48 TaxID=1618344 RepID=A0A0G0YHG8_UNCC2|nr:MAG: hypothetical protein UT47_C0003G0072 [candidate division CPR2 bacterium GW2011_GWC2_39_35]KKR29356.1 MAG: hypothetical protein UT60_C0003G0033 [candidate division CPR2 bacterium GW2011_GWD2_39_7]KKS09011.1 MAG: hypothetical protein UU65_C0003G0066 [candidate division CPR2 bacterium GW2011_GWC1_41_48]OGB71178.1 MAG: hypothetical protein A2Y26_04170 [candidate division CPR2 bacterium GWD2_39_7]HBG81914.1 hypothetical protein [candidate division CPR2 bacterium]